MAEVTTTIRLDTPKADVWKTIWRFDAVPRWRPRRIVTSTGDVIEELDDSDDAAGSYRCEVTHSPLPIDESHATFRVREDNDGAIVAWDSDLRPLTTGAVTALRELFRSGRDDVNELMGRGTF